MSAKQTLEVLQERVAAVPEALRQTLTGPAPELPAEWRGLPVVATGLGSSAAAAHLLVSELDRLSGSRGAVRETSWFFQRERRPEGAILVVFSQGLSRNARIALRQAGDFAGLIVVTSVSDETERSDLQELLQGVHESGGQLWRHPLENEYTILPRVLGPVCAAAVALRLAAALAGADLAIPAAFLEDLAPDWARPDTSTAATMAEEWCAGADFNFTNGLAGVSHNLAAKTMEGILRPLPACRDVFEFAHGAFQLSCILPRHQWLFSGPNEAEAALRRTVAPLYAKGPKPRELVAPYGAPWDLFHFEQLLNHVLCAAVADEAIDLVNWPGKGEDDAGYRIDQAFDDEAPA